jgi:predicted transcriptional regulator
MRDDSEENRILEGLFLRDKPAKILLGLRTNEGPVYATILSREANCTYSHTIKILDVLRDMGVVEFKKKGRIKRVVLTESGSDIAQHMEKMVSKFLKLESGPKKPDNNRKSDGVRSRKSKK